MNQLLLVVCSCASVISHHYWWFFIGTPQVHTESDSEVREKRGRGGNRSRFQKEHLAD